MKILIVKCKNTITQALKIEMKREILQSIDDGVLILDVNFDFTVVDLERGNRNE